VLQHQPDPRHEVQPSVDVGYQWDRINIAEVLGVQVISLDQAPEGNGEFDAGVPKKFVIDPHKLCSAA